MYNGDGVFASVAQWIEHWPPTPRVAGSNPVRCIDWDTIYCSKESFALRYIYT